MRCRAGGQLDLGDFARFPQSRRGHPVAAHIDAGLVAETIGEMFEDELVHVGAAELGVAAGRLHLEHAFAEFHDRDVERAAAEVDDGNPQLLAEPVEPIGERGRRRLVDQPHDLETGDAGGVLGGVALVVVEVGGNGHHRLLDRLAEKSLGVALDLLQQKAGKLFGREFAVAQPHLLAAAHQPFERRGGAFGVHGRLPAGGLADEHLSVGGQRDIARKCLAAQGDALGARDDDRPSAAQHGGGRVRRAKVNANDRHGWGPLSICHRYQIAPTRF